MDEIRKEIAAIQNAERAELIQRFSRWNQDVAFSRLGMAVITVFNLMLVITIYVLARREIIQRERIRRTLEEQVRERTAELSELSSNLQTVQEEERARLARPSHELAAFWCRARWMFLGTIAQDKDAILAQHCARYRVLDEGVDVKRRIIQTAPDGIGNWVSPPPSTGA
jgi:hypothetical protein